MADNHINIEAERAEFEAWAKENAIRTDLGTWDAWKARATFFREVRRTPVADGAAVDLPPLPPSRSAGDAVPEAWQWRHRLKGDKGWGAWAPITKGRYDRRADYPNSQFRELFGAAPAPGNTEKPDY